MNRYILFHFRPGDSLLHRADPRIKSAAYLFFNVALAAAALPGLALAAAALFFGYAGAREPFFRPLRAGWPILLLAAAVLLSRATGAGGGPAESALLHLGPLALSRTGLQSGGTFALRLIIALYAANLFVATTAVRDLRQAARWALRPLSPAAASRLSAMIGLTVSFVPLLFDLSERIADGLRSRGLTPRRPVRYLTTLSVTVLRGMFYRSAEITAALESRGFTPEADPPDFAPLRRLGRSGLTATAVCAAATIVVVAGTFL